MTIRPATKEDKELVRELWVEFGAELGGPGYLRESWEEAWSDLSQTVRNGVALVAEEEGAAVGFVFCVLGDPGRKTAHVTDIYVRPAARNKGIGRALLAGILEPARAAGLEHASLEVLIRNSDARRLYERLDGRLHGCAARGARRSACERRASGLGRVVARADG